LIVQQAASRPPWYRRRPVVVAEGADVLPMAAAEVEGVAAVFPRCHKLHGPTATVVQVSKAAAYSHLVHIACHAYFDPSRPLASYVGLPSGESLRANDLPPGRAAPRLVFLSSCRSAEVAPLLGGEVFGLAAGMLGSGVRAVIAGLWPVADAEVSPLVWAFYRHLLATDSCRAMTYAQREALARPGSSPLHWAVFGLYGDPSALPPPGWWRKALNRRRLRRHEGIFRG
jgi:CHAT domain-containing protein